MITQKCVMQLEENHSCPNQRVSRQVHIRQFALTTVATAYTVYSMHIRTVAI